MWKTWTAYRLCLSHRFHDNFVKLSTQQRACCLIVKTFPSGTNVHKYKEIAESLKSWIARDLFVSSYSKVKLVNLSNRANEILANLSMWEQKN